MISKYAVYANVTKVTCHDGKERYLILCPDDWTEEEFTCEGCPFYRVSKLPIYIHGRVPQECYLMHIGHDDHLCDTFEEVRTIIEPFYDKMFRR